MSFIDRNDEKDDFWDLDKLVPKKRSASLSPFTTKPTVKDYYVDVNVSMNVNVNVSVNPGEPRDDKALQTIDGRAEERKLTVTAQRAAEYGEERVYYPENTLMKSITVKRYKDKYDFYDNFRKAAILYYDCPGEKCDFAQFYSYMPQYSQLNKAQKSYYLYWRSEMRQGRFIKTDYSYLYLYVYEIINLPDVVEPERGVKLLCRLWKEYRKALPRIDMYFSIWVRDYCLVHELPCPISELHDIIFDVIRISDFKEYYFTSIGTTSRDGVWSLIAYLSDYDWHKGFLSVVGQPSEDGEYLRKSELYRNLLEGAMRVILPTVWDACMKEKERGNLVKISRSAFPNTLCSHSVKCKLDIEYYPLADATQLRVGITVAVRYTENKLRSLFGAKSRLSIKYIPLEYKELIDCYFDELIRKNESRIRKREAPEYERLYDAPSEKLSFEGADEIERLSWDTTMRLCDTDEYTPDEDSDDIPAPVSQQTADDNKVSDSTKNTYGLTESEIAYIAALCESSECGTRGINDEAIVERINEAFSDGFGDVIIEDTGDGFAIIEDYKEEITEWLKNI